ncbi:uncharacterized protein ISCGN_001857 [Ixodes scapularis]
MCTAKMSVRLWYGTVTVIFLCTFPAQWGASDVQTCGSALLTSCFPADGARSPKVKFQIRGVTVESIKEDCTNADAISTCVNDLKMDGCRDEERRQLQLLKDGLRTTRNSLCHEDLYQSKYGEYACFLKSAEGCPSTSLAREAVNDLYNTNLDLNNCTRFDRSSGKQRCDAERYWECFKRAEDRTEFPKAREEKLLAEDCKVLESVDSCTKYMENGGCSDEIKQKLQYLKSDFASLRSHLCDPSLYTSVLEWNQCLNKSAFQSCLKLLPQDPCSTGNYNCFLNATTRCTRDSPAMKAVHHAINIHLDLKNCSRVSGTRPWAPLSYRPRLASGFRLTHWPVQQRLQ